MNVQEIIGRIIIDIFVWSKMEVGGYDEASVFIELDNGKIIGIPWDFESENIEEKLQEGSKSLFLDLSDIPVHSINLGGKTIQEVLAAKKKNESSFWGRIRKAIGLEKEISKTYQIYKTGYRENKLKYLKKQKIVDFLVVDNADSVGFIELENGYIITETAISPHGTGMAGLNYYESIKHFEENHGTNYQRMKN